MPTNMTPGQTRTVSVSLLGVGGIPSTATIKTVTYAISPAGTATVAPNPSVTNGGIVTAETPATSPATTFITATIAATQPDGSAFNINVSDSITVTDSVTGVPAVSAAFVWGA